jgi:DNA segregation ATPase FtsK/SpoIIIE, S-DNA-T family
MMMIGLAAQYRPFDPAHPSGGARFYLLDGSPADSPFEGMLSRLSNVIPHPIRDVTWRELAGAMGEIAAEVERRREAEAGDAPTIFLIIYDLQRFRDLRKSDDDFGFSSTYGSEEKADPPSKLLGNILKEGPAVGVHTIIWCDSLNNLNRTFDRSALREFENRILFQMSANDSSTLIDSPAASRLGPNRALFNSEELGKLEKFRPYGFPSDDWLAMVHTKLSGRIALPAPAAAGDTEPAPNSDGNGATPDKANGSTIPSPDGSGVYAANADEPAES